MRVKKPEEYSYRNRLAYHSTLLGSFALLVSAALVLGNVHTHDQIQQRKVDDMRTSLLQVVPGKLYDNDLMKDSITINDGGKHTIYRARKADAIVAYAFVITTQGYSGPVDLVIGISNRDEIIGVRVISHSETPGLGDKMEIGKSNWILGFNGHSLANTTAREWHVKKDGGKFDQFTGATITPRAIVKSVHEGLEFFGHHRQELIAEAPLTTTEDKTNE